MPDRDGLSETFGGQRRFCHECQKWIQRKEIKQHRRKCGPLWKARYQEIRTRKPPPQEGP